MNAAEHEIYTLSYAIYRVCIIVWDLNAEFLVPWTLLSFVRGSFGTTHLFDGHDEFDGIKTIQCELLEGRG